MHKCFTMVHRLHSYVGLAWYDSSCILPQLYKCMIRLAAHTEYTCKYEHITLLLAILEFVAAISSCLCVSKL